jgi:ribonuclease R
MSLPSASGKAPESAAETAESLLELFETHPSQRLTFGQIRTALEGSSFLSDAIDHLVETGLLWASGSRFMLPAEAGVFRGVLRVRPGGTASARTDSGRMEIDRRNLGGALDGDAVMIRRLDALPGEEGFSGRVEAVLTRARIGLSGIVRRAGRGWVLDSLDPSLPRGIPLRAGKGMIESVAEGRLIHATLDYSSARLSALAVKDLGDPSSPGALIRSVAEDRGLPERFPEDVLNDAVYRASTPFPIAGRQDLRNLPTVTIDPVDARDFDDAISIERDGTGYTLRVHIADVAWYVPIGSPTDAEARKRGTSVYLPDRVIPMLPEELSAGACSLRPDEDRPTRTVVMRFDHDGGRLDFSIGSSVIRSGRRMTYEEALEYMDGGGDDPGIRDLLRLAGEFSSILDRVRERRGALDLGGSEFRVEFGADGWPEGFHRVPSDKSHRMIENFMVEANRAVADHCSWTGLPVLYRAHDDPDRESEMHLADRLSELGIELPGGRVRNPTVLAGILKTLEGSPLADLVRESVLRSLRKADYRPANTGHFGLALRSYMHFTSPIRRYPDLLVHQVLAEVEAGRMPPSGMDLESAAESSSSTERTAEAAEREAIDLLAAAYLSRQVGGVFRGTVSGVHRFGVFVRLEGVPAEGLCPAAEIRRGGFPFRGSSGPFREGAMLDVMVVSADPIDRRITLRPVKLLPGLPAGPAGGGGHGV